MLGRDLTIRINRQSKYLESFLNVRTVKSAQLFTFVFCWSVNIGDGKTIIHENLSIERTIKSMDIIPNCENGQNRVRKYLRMPRTLLL